MTVHWTEAILQKREKPKSHDHVIPLWGGGIQAKKQQNSDIVLLLIYFLSN